MIRRHELTDQEWELLAPLIPRAATGRPRVEDRQVVNGMVYKIRTGISWRDLPEHYGPWQTVYTRFRRYALDGVFTRALQQIQAHVDAADDIDWLVQIDSTIVRAHQHAAATGLMGSSTTVGFEPTNQLRSWAKGMLMPLQIYSRIDCVDPDQSPASACSRYSSPIRATAPAGGS
ncbi:IS5 family transposase [Streptomyces sp. NPDC048420]|uniref:IS5 family transposase n=1 Tax=Streptomyces sp. NPDC048420 TaxID=3155755 RepID=UPI0034364372